MARIKYEIAAAFARHKPAKGSSAFQSMGDAIYSYNMRLAHWEGEGEDARIVFDYPGRGVDGYKAPSATTNAHMHALESVVGPGGRVNTDNDRVRRHDGGQALRGEGDEQQGA